MKKKIFSVFFALVLVLTLALVAAPVGAAGTTDVSLRSGGNGSEEWSTDEFRSGDYSAKLSVVDWGPDYGLVNIFFKGILLKDLPVDPTFFAKGVSDDGLGPYLNILIVTEGQNIYDPTGTYNDALEGVVATSFSGWGNGWHEMFGGGYYDADESLGQGTATQDLAFWQSEAGDILVVGVQILFGAMGNQGSTPGQTVYIDDVNFDGSPYDLEPATGPVTLTAFSVIPAPVIGIEVDRTTVDFGQLIPGIPSAPETIALKNIGNVAEDFTASILNESHPPVYQNGLEIGDVPFSPPGALVPAWGVGSVTDGHTVNQDLVLTVPVGTIAGTYEATLIFWAEAAA